MAKASAKPLIENESYMELKIAKAFNTKIITPFSYRGRSYHVLFYEDVKGPFEVYDSPYIMNSMLSVGEIYTPRKGRLVGNIFYTNVQHMCQGSFLLIYSGVFRDQINKRLPKDLRMPVIIKTPDLQIYGEKNKAVLIVSPFLKRDIIETLEQ